MHDPLLERLRRALAPEFDVERPLASGGMGTVYLGRESALGRLVAIKILKPEIATAEFEERFLREAQTLATFNHPNIVPILRPHRADGIPLYIMPYLEGETLQTRLAAAAPLPAEEVVRIGADLLSALDEAHRHGIIHRDVKPGNIFLLPDRAMLVDFGIAKSVTRDDQITDTQQRLGTRKYMAPEQHTGGPVTPATDLYSTGMVLYEAVTGREWPSLEQPAAANWDGVPGALMAALQRALELTPQERWQDAVSFRRAFRVERRRTRVLPWLTAALLAVAAGVGILVKSCIPTPVLLPDVVVRPFAVAPGVDSSLGEDVSLQTGEILRAAGLTVQRAGAGRTATHIVTGRIAQGDSDLYLAVQVLSSDGKAREAETVRAHNRWDLANAAAFVAFHAARPQQPLPADLQCPPHTVGAEAAYFDGVAAFKADDWGTAERRFEQAVQSDPEFCLAEWRLWTVQRWRRSPETVDLARLLERHGDQLPRADRLVIEAELTPDHAARWQKYGAAIQADPFGGVAPLFYGSDLFHRGPLFGTPLDSAVVWFREAIARDSSLAPAYDQLIWALIRLGDRAEARRALDALRRTVVAGADRAVPPEVFELAFLARFDPPAFERQLTQTGAATSLGALAKFVRVGQSLDVAPAQGLIGAALASRGELPAEARAQGHIAAALASLAMGAPARGLRQFDSAAMLMRSAELAEQAAEWRLLATAVGIPGVAAPSPTGTGGVASARSLWAQAVAAYAAGDTAAGRRWTTRLPVGEAPAPLLTLLNAYAAAARGDPSAAVRLSAPLREVQVRNGLDDPFARALLNLGRARWLEAVGERAAATLARGWHQNADFTGWLSGPMQSAEVDWVSGTYARWRDGVRRVTAGDRAACADLLRVAALWHDAEPAVQALMETGRAARLACAP